jgi:betaine-aldehyde dehydrogenase
MFVYIYIGIYVHTNIHIYVGKDMLNHSGTEIGPIISKVQYEKVWQYIDEAKKDGYNFLYGGERMEAKKEFTGSSSGESKTHSGAGEKGMGFFIGPTILIDVPTTSRIWTEEIFGPVLCIREFGTEDEAVLVANDSTYVRL